MLPSGEVVFSHVHTLSSRGIHDPDGRHTCLFADVFRNGEVLEVSEYIVLLVTWRFFILFYNMSRMNVVIPNSLVF